MDDLGALFAFSLGLFRHGTQHGFRQINLLYFDVRDFHAVGCGVLVQNALDAGIQFVTVRQQFVQFDFAQHRPQSGLGKLLRLPVIVLYLHHCLRGVDHAPVDHGVHFQGDVIAGDDVLWRDFKRLLAQVNPYHLLNRRKYQDEPWAFGVLLEAAKRKDYATLIFAQDLDAVKDIEKNNDNRNKDKKHRRLHQSMIGEVERILWHMGNKSKNYPAIDG